MFDLRSYIKKGFLDAVGKMSDYQIILNSAGWMEKGVLTEDDLSEINTAIEAQYIVEEPVIEEQDTEDPVIDTEAETGDTTEADIENSVTEEPDPEAEPETTTE